VTRLQQFIKDHLLAVALVVIGIPIIIGVATLKPKPQVKPQAEPVLLTVNTIKAEPKTWQIEVTTQGTVEPKREINLVAEVSGRIIDTSAEFVSGGFAKANQVLIKIDPRDYQYAVIHAQARLADAQQALATEKGRVRQANREWRDLGNKEANDLFLRKPQAAAARAKLESALADLHQAQLNLERTEIKLPFSGRLRKTLVNLGQFVSPGTPLVSVYDSNIAEIRLPLTERQAALVDLPLDVANQPIDPAKVTLLGSVAGREHQWQGLLTRTDASIDTRSRLYYAIAEVQNTDAINKQMPSLIMGLFVEAKITGRDIDNVIRIPKQALFQSLYVYTLNPDHQVHVQPVKVLYSTPQFAWIQADINSESLIITDKQNFLSEGMTVNPQLTTAEQ
jgi:RND family efflux transporter MFP subunit